MEIAAIARRFINSYWLAARKVFSIYIQQTPICPLSLEVGGLRRIKGGLHGYDRFLLSVAT